MDISKLNIPLSVVIGKAELLLLGVSPVYQYTDNKRTDVVVGYRYEVVETDNYDKLSVKINSAAPAVTTEQLEKAENRYRVAFEECYAKPYRLQSGGYDLSFTASKILFLK